MALIKYCSCLKIKHLLPFSPTHFKFYATEATVDVPAFKLYNIEDAGPATSVKITSADGLKFYEQMLVVRRMEQTLAAMYQAKLVRGFLHLYAGEEAVAVGIKATMRDKDTIVTGYRCHAWAWLMGTTIRSILAELAGRQTGPSQGKGGSMHMYGKNFYGGHGIVGAQVPVGVGIGFAHKYRKEDTVSVTCYGDGAANQGQVFESFNLSKLWNLPVVFICENNQYAMGTAKARGAANPEFFTRCEYIPGIWVDAMDVLAVREASRYAMQRTIQGKGPIIIEMVTYRYYGHSMADPGTSYRSRDEIQAVRQTRDPIETFKAMLLKNQLATEDEFKKIDAAVKKTNDEALKMAKEDKEPGLEQLGADREINPIRKTCRGIAPWDTIKLISSKKPVNLSI